MEILTNAWQKLLLNFSFKKEAKEPVEVLERRVAKLERLNVALVKKLVLLGHIDASLPGENSAIKDVREERTIH